MTLDEQIKSVEREIGMRERVYPAWVRGKRMSQEKADHEMAAMRATLKTLIELRDGHRAPASPWVSVSLALPDDDCTVMVAIKGDSEPVWLGYIDGGIWTNVDGSPIANPVTHWQHLPAGPK